MRKLNVSLALCFALLLQGCMPRYYIKDSRVQTPPPKESDFWWGVAATGTGATLALSSHSSGRDQFGVGTALGGLIVLWGLDRFVRYYSAKFWYPRLMTDAPKAEAIPQGRDEELAKARQAEAEGRWANAWGSYRRAKDLGPPSQFIEDKLLEMEGKLEAPKKP